MQPAPWKELLAWRGGRLGLASPRRARTARRELRARRLPPRDVPRVQPKATAILRTRLVVKQASRIRKHALPRTTLGVNLLRAAGAEDGGVPPRSPRRTAPAMRRPPQTERTLAAHPSLKRTDAFLAVYRRGRWARGPSLSVGALPTDEHGARVGLRTRRGLKGAATRNRLKRQLRAILSADRFRFRNGLDLVVVIHPTRVPARTSSLERELITLCTRLGAFS